MKWWGRQLLCCAGSCSALWESWHCLGNMDVSSRAQSHHLQGCITAMATSSRASSPLQPQALGIPSLTSPPKAFGPPQPDTALGTGTSLLLSLTSGCLLGSGCQQGCGARGGTKGTKGPSGSSAPPGQPPAAKCVIGLSHCGGWGWKVTQSQDPSVYPKGMGGACEEEAKYGGGQVFFFSVY